MSLIGLVRKISEYLSEENLFVRKFRTIFCVDFEVLLDIRLRQEKKGRKKCFVVIYYKSHMNE
ncbi:CLUMA_CG008253, isoform A [Clunio marinus]|uniref:CLUMA_CG008253, isoform A n=1 Tax=Clunio marinus TaxID=568069 RepID=A0A1J1I341_9DIPT|nr:CLUMA_CG008253, isoform A [Clunio marinus]